MRRRTHATQKAFHHTYHPHTHLPLTTHPPPHLLRVCALTSNLKLTSAQALSAVSFGSLRFSRAVCVRLWFFAQSHGARLCSLPRTRRDFHKCCYGNRINPARPPRAHTQHPAAIRARSTRAAPNPTQYIYIVRRHEPENARCVCARNPNTRRARVCARAFGGKPI